MDNELNDGQKNHAPLRLDYRNKLILAPMVRVNTLPMRLLALRMGADIVYTEELIDWKLMKCKRKENPVLGTVDFVEDDGNIVFRTCPIEKDRLVLQIGTACAERALRAAKLVEKDVSGIDINMGCPKEFSVKGGMGVALAANIENAKKILTTLVSSLSGMPVTCKIRIRKTTEETIAHVRELESTGISAIGIHARTRDERPQHKPHPEVVKAVAEAISIPVICNGGSKEIDRHADIFKYKELCGASSIMIARAAEWNVSIFRPNGLLPLMDVISEYLKLAVDYDSYAANAKYCVQNMLRELQESEMGRKFLDAQTLEQICEVFQLKEYCKEKQTAFKQKLAILARNENDGEPKMKRPKLDDGSFEEPITFIRSNYLKDVDLPKSILHAHTKQKLRTVPKYETEQQDRLFRSILTLHNKKYTTTVWDKSKKYAEQAAAIVCLLHLGLTSREDLLENGSLNPYEL